MLNIIPDKRIVELNSKIRQMEYDLIQLKQQASLTKIDIENPYAFYRDDFGEYIIFIKSYELDLNGNIMSVSGFKIGEKEIKETTITDFRYHHIQSISKGNFMKQYDIFTKTLKEQLCKHLV